jgi:Domain of unknown function (DUF4277)
MEQTYRRHIFDHRGLVAGMCEALGLGDGIAKATQHHPAMPIVTAGNAVTAMVRNGLGCVNQRLDLVPQCCQHTPTSRRIAPAMAPAPRHDETLGRAFETRDDDGGTALYRLMAATAAPRLGRSPTLAHLARTSFQVAGRDTSDAEPDAQVIPLTQGYRRDQRPDRNPVLLDLRVAHHAGLPIWRQPLRGNRREVTDVGPIGPAPSSQLSTTDGTTDLVADRARSRDDHLQQLAEPPRHWMTRVPATVHAAQTALAQVLPETMPPWMEGSRDHECRSTSGGVPPCWVLLDSERRQPHVPRTVHTPLRKPGAKAVHALQQLCRVACACDAEAPPALATCAHGLAATFVHERTVRASPRDGQRGRPRHDAQPAPGTSHRDGARASRLATRQARVDPHRGVILATHALADVRLPPQGLLDSDQGPGPAERGLRFLKDPQFLASSCSRNKPARLMALLLVLTVCLLV